MTRSQAIKQELKARLMQFWGISQASGAETLLDSSVLWFSSESNTFEEKAKTVGVLAAANEDVCSFCELLILGHDYPR